MYVNIDIDHRKPNKETSAHKIVLATIVFSTIILLKHYNNGIPTDFLFSGKIAFTTSKDSSRLQDRGFS